jgi:hypothetical protein
MAYRIATMNVPKHKFICEASFKEGWVAEPITAYRLLQWNSKRLFELLEWRLDL